LEQEGTFPTFQGTQAPPQLQTFSTSHQRRPQLAGTFKSAPKAAQQHSKAFLAGGLLQQFSRLGVCLQSSIDIVRAAFGIAQIGQRCCAHVRRPASFACKLIHEHCLVGSCDCTVSSANLEQQDKQLRKLILITINALTHTARLYISIQGTLQVSTDGLRITNLCQHFRTVDCL